MNKKKEIIFLFLFYKTFQNMLASLFSQHTDGDMQSVIVASNTWTPMKKKQSNNDHRTCVQ